MEARHATFLMNKDEMKCTDINLPLQHYINVFIMLLFFEFHVLFFC